MSMMSTFGRRVKNTLNSPDNVYHVDNNNPIYQKPSATKVPLLETQSSHEFDDTFDDGMDDSAMPNIIGEGARDRERSTDYSSSSSSSSSSEDEDDVSVTSPLTDELPKSDNNSSPYAVPSVQANDDMGVSTFTSNRGSRNIYDLPIRR